MYVLRCYWWVLGRRYFISFLIIYLSLSALRFPFFFFPKLKFTDFLICFPTFFNPAFIIIFYISFSVSYTASYSSLVFFPTLSSCLMLSLSWPVKNLSSPVIFISPILSVRLSSHVSQQSPLALATVTWCWEMTKQAEKTLVMTALNSDWLVYCHFSLTFFVCTMTEKLRENQNSQKSRVRLNEFYEAKRTRENGLNTRI